MHWGSSRSVLQQNSEIQRGSAGRHIIYICIYICRAVKNKRSSSSFRVAGHQTSVQYVGRICGVCMMYENCKFRGIETMWVGY